MLRWLKTVVVSDWGKGPGNGSASAADAVAGLHAPPQARNVPFWHQDELNGDWRVGKAIVGGYAQSVRKFYARKFYARKFVFPGDARCGIISPAYTYAIQARANRRRSLGCRMPVRSIPKVFPCHRGIFRRRT